MNLTLSLLLGIAFQIFIIAISHPTVQNLNDLDRECVKTFSKGEIQEIFCPRYNPVIHVVFSEYIYEDGPNSLKYQGYRIDVNCAQGLMKSENYSLLQNFSVGDIFVAEFKNCPLPLDKPIVNIVKRLGQPKLTKLKFSAGQDEKIQPMHLKGLEGIISLELKNIKFSDTAHDIFDDNSNSSVNPPFLEEDIIFQPSENADDIFDANLDFSVENSDDIFDDNSNLSVDPPFLQEDIIFQPSKKADDIFDANLDLSVENSDDIFDASSDYSVEEEEDVIFQPSENADDIFDANLDLSVENSDDIFDDNSDFSVDPPFLEEDVIFQPSENADDIFDANLDFSVENSDDIFDDNSNLSVDPPFSQEDIISKKADKIFYANLDLSVENSDDIFDASSDYSVEEEEDVIFQPSENADDNFDANLDLSVENSDDIFDGNSDYSVEEEEDVIFQPSENADDIFDANLDLSVENSDNIFDDNSDYSVEEEEEVIFQPSENAEDDIFDDNSDSSVNLPFLKGFSIQPLNYVEDRKQPKKGYFGVQEIMFNNPKSNLILNLRENNLTSLPATVFEGITTIKELDLSSNQFTTFHSNSFSLLKNLTNINIKGNYLPKLPENLFQNNKLLDQIRLVSNWINSKELPNRLFSNLSHLKEINITSNTIQVIPNDLFEGSPNLENITIKQNLVEMLPEHLFDHQTKLMNLDLSENKIIRLKNFIFVNNQKLKTLRLSNNGLESIELYAFRGLVNLESLELDTNRLINLTPKMMEPLLNLKKIYLQNNYLHFIFDFDIGSPLHPLRNIEIINLSKNNITGIYPDWYTILTELKTLDLSYNQIDKINKEDLQFSRTNLTLNLSHNEISTINLNNIENSFQKSDSMTKIDMNNNPLSCNCDNAVFNSLIRKDKPLYVNISQYLIFETNELYCNGPIDSPYELSGKKIIDVSPREFVCRLDDPKSQIQSCPTNCSCWFRTFDRSLIVNCSSAGLREVPTLVNDTAKRIAWIELHIENNYISQLPTIDDLGYDQIQELYAQNNSIKTLKTENIPKELKVLNLSHNKFEFLSESVLVMLNQTRSLNNISLRYNPWHCDCELSNLLSFIQRKRKFINDADHLKCANSTKLLMSLTYVDICNGNKTEIIVVSIVFALLAICICTIVALYYKYQTEFKLWLFYHNYCLGFITEEELDKDKKNDAFISYSHKDETFVTDYLKPELENGPNPFKLCLHVRDWIPGIEIKNQIQESVENSRRTIVILSENFLESVWGQMEFRTAHTAALLDGRARVIVIIYGDIGDIENLDPDLKAYLETNTYIKWGDPWFWNKLRFAMPHPQNIKILKTKGLVTAIKSSTNDKLELNKPIEVTPPLTTPSCIQAGINAVIANNNSTYNGTGNGLVILYSKQNGLPNVHVNNAFVINTNSKQSDV